MRLVSDGLKVPRSIVRTHSSRFRLSTSLFGRPTLRSPYKNICCIFLAVLVAPAATAQVFTISGTIRDSSSKEILPATTIRVLGTSKGTIANVQGNYALSLDRDKYRLVFTFIGYRADTVDVSLERNLELNVNLVPSVIQMAEVVVTGEDPAIAIMRHVIENKSRWMNSLTTYQFEAFTRQTIRRDTAIASIMETYSTGYWRKGDTLREVIRQKRQTENVPISGNFASVGGIANFYDDEVRFGGFTFIGPTSPEAFDYYDFKLEKSREVNGKTLFSINMIPKSRVTPLFKGSLQVVDEDFSLAGVDVTPNEAFNFPFISGLNIRYAQQFALIDRKYWMPVDIRFTARAEIGIAGISFPALGMEGISSIYEYKINEEVPDSLFHKRRRIETKEAKTFDSTFWAQREVLPLTAEEKTAYKKLDSTQSLDKQFQPTGPLVTLGDVSGAGIRYLDIRYNRVEGLYLGADVTIDTVFNSVNVHASLGSGLSDKRWSGVFGGNFFFDTDRYFSAGAEFHRTMQNIPDENYQSDFLVALGSLFAKSDYRNYYYSSGWKISLATQPFRRFAAEATLLNEQETSVSKRTDYSFIDRALPFRPNPAITEGTMRSVEVKLHLGGRQVPLNIVESDQAELDMEAANKNLLGGDFDFTRAVIRASYHVADFLRRNFLAPTLAVRFLAGIGSSNLPVQRTFTLDSKYIDLGPQGVLRGAGVKEFAGDRVIVMSIEQNFRSIPFLWLDVPFLYKNQIEILTVATVAKSEFASNPAALGSSTNGWYSEAGIGISRILGLLRVDVTRRFVSTPGYSVTVAIATVL